MDKWHFYGGIRIIKISSSLTTYILEYTLFFLIIYVKIFEILMYLGELRKLIKNGKDVILFCSSSSSRLG